VNAGRSVDGKELKSLESSASKAGWVMLSPRKSERFPKKGRTEMRTLKPLILAASALLTLLLFVPATPAKAQMPAYLHALSDLRTARAYLQMDMRPEGQHARAHAVDEISRAIDDIKVAAGDDGKNPWHTPAPQSGGNPGWPVHSAVRLLREARGDVDHGHDMPENHGLRERSVDHIDHALRELEPFL
jgi:hypothetical protein